MKRTSIHDPAPASAKLWWFFTALASELWLILCLQGVANAALDIVDDAYRVPFVYVFAVVIIIRLLRIAKPDVSIQSISDHVADHWIVPGMYWGGFALASLYL